MQNKIHVLCKKHIKKIYNAGGGGGIRKNMKNDYKLYYTLLSFREFLHFSTQKESILLLQLILDSEVLY